MRIEDYLDTLELLKTSIRKEVCRNNVDWKSIKKKIDLAEKIDKKIKEIS